MQLSEAQKLILMMLCDIHAHLKIKDSVDPEFVTAAIHGGHLWALKDRYPGIFDIPETPAHVVEEVEDIMWVWSRLESDFAALSAAEKKRVLNEGKVHGDAVTFDGFDGNNEGPYLSTARFIIQHLDKYEEWKDHKMNSHSPSVESYRRMLPVFKATELKGGRMSVDHMIAVLTARFPS